MSADTKEGSQYSGDVEKQHAVHMNSDLHGKTTVLELEALDDGVPRNKGIFAKLWKIAARFDAFGAETRGIERVMPEDRPVVRFCFPCLILLFRSRSSGLIES